MIYLSFILTLLTSSPWRVIWVHAIFFIKFLCFKRSKKTSEDSFELLKHHPVVFTATSFTSVFLNKVQLKHKCGKNEKWLKIAGRKRPSKQMDDWILLRSCTLKIWFIFWNDSKKKLFSWNFWNIYNYNISEKL